MLYSRWIPDGQYEVYDAPDEVRGLGDDLPTPHLPAAEKFGVPSTECGRPLPSGARLVGVANVPRGLVAPMAVGALSGGTTSPASNGVGRWIALGMLAGVALYVVTVPRGRR